MEIHELRDPDEARDFVRQGLLLTRRPVPAAQVRSCLEWALEVASGGEPLPPVGFVADLGCEAFDLAREAAPRGDVAPPGVPHTLWRAYEDHVLGKVYADWTFDRARDALKGYAPGRDRARGLAFLVNQFRRRAGFAGVLLPPSVIRAMLGDAPDETLRRGRESLQAGGPLPLLEQCYRSLVAAARRTAEVLSEADVRALENRVALADEGQRLAHDQVIRAMIELRDELPPQRPRPPAGRREVPTRVLAEDTYPVGGFSSISTRGTVESLLHSQLAFMDDRDRPDLFDVKYVRDELYYYARDENQFLRRRRSFVFALYPDLARARFKDPALNYQHVVYLLGLAVAAVEKLTEWLSDDALHFDFAFPHEEGSSPLRHEYELLEMLFRERIADGTVSLDPARTEEALAELCRARARRSLCDLLTISMEDRPLTVEDVRVTRLILTQPGPALAHADDPAPTGLDWPRALEALLQGWV